jgi:uncharacterized SAM-binding protein YcdF (DUF218 family)
MRSGRGGRAFRIFCLLVALVWLIGLVIFAQSIETLEARPLEAPDADVIVVLTGGSERLGAGLDLLADHKGKKLFISGVHRGLSLDQLTGTRKIPEDLRKCCIALGHAAESTFGNAWETRAWMEAGGYHSMHLVTSNYHMARSLMIFQKVMPDFEILPYSVSPDSVRLEDWWERKGTASLLVTEYNKYILAALRLWVSYP